MKFKLIVCFKVSKLSEKYPVRLDQVTNLVNVE